MEGNNSNKTYDSLIKEFFGCFQYINHLADIFLNDNSFLSDDDFSDILRSGFRLICIIYFIYYIINFC